MNRYFTNILICFVTLIVTLFAEQTTVTIQEKWSGSKCDYNVEDVAFNWRDSGLNPRAYYWFQDCPH